MAVTDPRLAELSRHAPIGDAIAIGFVEETDDHRYTNTPSSSATASSSGTTARSTSPPTACSTRAASPGPATGSGRRRWGATGPHRPERARTSAPSVPMTRPRTGFAAREHRRRTGPRPGSSAGLAAIAGWHKMQETYALLGTVAVAFCNRVGNEEGLTFWGGSRLIGANGAVWPRRRCTRRRSSSASSTPTTCGCSATSPSWPTSGSS